MNISRKAIFWIELFLASILAVFVPETVRGADMVRYRVFASGQANASDAAENEETLSGKIRKTTATGVVLLEDGKERIIPANQVIWTQFDKEPINLTTARTLLQTSRFDEALAKLSEIPAGERNALPPMVQADLEYQTACAAALRALARKKHDELVEAGRLLNRFVKDRKDNWHETEANELIGMILLALEKPASAKTFYDRLANSTWPDVKLKALNASANISLHEKKFEEAKKTFEQVIAFSESHSALIMNEKLVARIGLGRLLTAQGRPEEAIAAFNKLIAEKNSLNSDEIGAKLYNAYGAACEAAGKTKDALLAYLHTDLLYSTARVEHVAALRALYRLWKLDFREDRAAEVLKTLRNEYKIVDNN